MGWSGALSAWAFRKQAAIVREHNRKEEEDYLKELKKKLKKYIEKFKIWSLYYRTEIVWLSLALLQVPLSYDGR